MVVVLGRKVHHQLIAMEFMKEATLWYFAHRATAQPPIVYPPTVFLVENLVAVLDSGDSNEIMLSPLLCVLNLEDTRTYHAAVTTRIRRLFDQRLNAGKATVVTSHYASEETPIEWAVRSRHFIKLEIPRTDTEKQQIVSYHNEVLSD